MVRVGLGVSKLGCKNCKSHTQTTRGIVKQKEADNGRYVGVNT